MFTKLEIEELILGMAELVRENRMLWKKLDELSLSNAKNEALAFGKHKEYEILSDIEHHNISVESCHSRGWLTNQDYIDDWQAEFRRRMEEEGLL